MSISVSGVTAPAAFQYDFNTLVQIPTVSAVTPLRGPTIGGTLVTLRGTMFAGDATVLFVELRASGETTGNLSSFECIWRAAGAPGVSCNDTVVR